MVTFLLFAVMVGVGAGFVVVRRKRKAHQAAGAN
jgi:F0F1-type ATP synthase assembly protein I